MTQWLSGVNLSNRHLVTGLIMNCCCKAFVSLYTFRLQESKEEHGGIQSRIAFQWLVLLSHWFWVLLLEYPNIQSDTVAQWWVLPSFRQFVASLIPENWSTKRGNRTKWLNMQREKRTEDEQPEEKATKREDQAGHRTSGTQRGLKTSQKTEEGNQKRT